jgi:hypothetical protein
MEWFAFINYGLVPIILFFCFGVLFVRFIFASSVNIFEFFAEKLSGGTAEDRYFSALDRDLGKGVKIP